MLNASYISLMVSEKMFEYVSEKLPFMSPWQPIKLSWETDLDKSNRLLSGSQFVSSLYVRVLYFIVLY